MFLEPPFNASEEPAPDREPTLAEQLGQFVRVARGAFSDNTERALKSDLAIYAEWCAERGERALPAKPETVAAFVDAKAEARAPATVRRYVTSIGIAHRALGLEKTVKSPPVQLALKRMHRRKGRRQDQATGLEQTGTSHCGDGACWLRGQAFLNPAPMCQLGAMDSVWILIGPLEGGFLPDVRYHEGGSQGPPPPCP